MGRFSPSGVGSYQPAPNYLADALSGLAETVQRRQEMSARQREAQAIRDERTRAAEAERAYRASRDSVEDDRYRETAALQQSNRALDLGLRGIVKGAPDDRLSDDPALPKYVPVGDTGFSQLYTNTPDGQRWQAQNERKQESNRLVDALQTQQTMGMHDVGNADVPDAGLGRFDPVALASLRSTQDPDLIRERVKINLFRPEDDAHTLQMAEAGERLKAKYREAPAPTLGTDYSDPGNPRMVQIGRDGIARPVAMAGGGVMGAKPLTSPGGRPSATQAKYGAFLTMAQDANKNLSGFGAPGLRDAIAASTPFVGNALMSGQGQLRQQSAFQLADAWLRFTSGANAPEPEVRRVAATFMPALGDSKAAIERKRHSREVIIEALSKAANAPASGIDPDILEALGGGP